MIKNTNLEQLQAIINANANCVVNLTADWCSDCTDQGKNLDTFAAKFEIKKIDVHTLSMQADKNVYLSGEHQHFTESVGGHGFPRTILFINGKAVDADNVEVISPAQLEQLADKFLQQL